MSEDGTPKHGSGPSPGDGTPQAEVPHAGPARSSPYPMSRLAPPYELVDVAREIQQADALLGAVTGSKLEFVARQIRALQDEARRLLEAAQRDGEFHRAACSFKKRPGRVYHLYRRPDGARYFSMLSPAEWGGDPPHAFEGSYRLEVDMSWTPAEEIHARESGDAGQLRRLLGPGT